MKIIQVKYEGECKKCGKLLEVGEQAEYERVTGIFCVGCFPINTEEIREYRQERADRKADRYQGWAAKRKERANAQLNSHPEIRHDIAFITQPGHIPFRARMNRQDGKAFESLEVADRMETKAASLRHVQVKGDAEKKHEARREAVRAWIKPGMMVIALSSNPVEVFKVNKKTATIKGNFGTYKQDLCLISKA